jgi:ubiquinone/menaquinone biosynthesis C-methylase UbiE
VLPFRDRQFDAVLSIGGFNHFEDPEAALREMVRVVRPGSTIVISDELPNLTDRMLGRKLGLPGLDRWIVARMMNLGYAFTDLVERHRDLDIAAIGRGVLRDCRYEVIWRGGGYLMVGQAP